MAAAVRRPSDCSGQRSHSFPQTFTTCRRWRKGRRARDAPGARNLSECGISAWLAEGKGGEANERHAHKLPGPSQRAGQQSRTGRRKSREAETSLPAIKVRPSLDIPQPPSVAYLPESGVGNQAFIFSLKVILFSDILIYSPMLISLISTCTEFIAGK